MQPKSHSVVSVVFINIKIFTFMKAKTLFLILLSSMLIVGCKNKSEENNEPTPPEPSFTKITEDQVKSYFPYAVDDKIIFYNDRILDANYTVKDFTLTNKSDKLNILVTMTGTDFMGTETYAMELKAELISNKILKMDFSERIITIPTSNVTGTYTYDASKGEELPTEIILSNGAIIKKDKGLVYYEDYDSNPWNFLRRN